MNYDVFGLGNALMDVQLFVQDSLLNDLKIEKGIMHLVDEEKSIEILNAISDIKSINIPGGSCANTLGALAMLGSKVAYTGVVADDMYGRLYGKKLSERGVKVLLRFKDTGLTGTSIILTSDDAERTMVTHLGVCREYTSEDVDMEIFRNSSIFHCTGYQWDTESQKETVEWLMSKANRLAKTVSFDIADPFCISRNVDDFKRIIHDYVDILFGNIDEAKILTGLEDPIEAGKAILKMGAKIAVVKVGSQGSYIFSGDEIIKIDVFKAEKVLDSTGCGDTYAAGFLYGYTKKWPLKKCGDTASKLASKIISVPGVQFEKMDFTKIKNEID